MTMFLIQALLWLLVAFLLGYGIARFLKSLFCRDRADADVYGSPMTTPKVDTGRAGTGGSGVSAATATVLGGAAAAAAGAVAVARDKLDDIGLPDMPEIDVRLPEVPLSAPALDVDLPDIGLTAPTMDFSGIDPHKPIVDPPDLDIDLPEVSMAAPEMDVVLPDMPEIDVGLPEVSLSAPALDVDLPDMKMATPEVAVDEGNGLPDLAKGAVAAAGAGLAAKAAMDFSGIDPHKPIVDPPDLDIELPDAGLGTPVATLEEGNDLLDLAKGVAIAAGAGLAASAVSADDTPVQDGEVDDVIDDETDWLHVLVQRVKEEYPGHNPRAVSKLWDVGSGYDCSAIDQYDSLSLEPAHYDKLGSSHCGVPRAGFVAVGGDVSDVGQGAAVLFHYCNIVVCRDADDKHHFIRVTG